LGDTAVGSWLFALDAVTPAPTHVADFVG
jgi:hypothetical protein